MKKSEKRLLIFLGLVVGYFTYDIFISKSDDEDIQVKSKQDIRQPVDNEQISGTGKKSRRKTTGIAKFASMDLSEISNWNNDPFLGSFKPELIDSLQGSTPYILKAIAWRDEMAHVIINNEVYKLGEEKDGFLVSEVRKNSVVCFKNGQRFVLTLGE